MTAGLTPAEYEDELRRYRFERLEEARAVGVGEKAVSEQAAIVERYAHVFSRAQLEALRRAEDEARDPEEQERLYRLRKSCEGGLVAAEVTAAQDELDVGSTTLWREARRAKRSRYASCGASSAVRARRAPTGTSC